MTTAEVGAHRRTRVLFCIPVLDGGPGSVFRNLVNTLDRDEFEPMLAVTEGGRLLAEVADDVEVVNVGRPSQRYPVVALARAVRSRAPDVVLSTLRMNFTALASTPLWPRRTRLVVRQATHISPNTAQIAARARIKGRAILLAYRALLPRADAIVCQSSFMRADIEQVAARAATRAVVVGNPVDVARVGAAADLPATLPPAGSPTLVAMGRLSQEKGFDLLLDALPAVLASAPGARLWIVGDGPSRAELEARAGRIGVSDRTTFAGFQANPHPFLRAADLFVSSSRYEGLANGILEALACGTPVVATRGPGTGDEILGGRRWGVLVEPSDVAALAAGITDAIRDLARFEIDPTTLESSFGVEAMTSAYGDVLRGVARHGARVS